MKEVKVFISFLKLAQRYFQNERDITFYAGELGLTPDELSQIIWNSSNSTLSEWLDVMEQVNLESRSYCIV